MDPSITLHLGHYRRYLWDEKNLLVVRGELPEVLVSRDAYEQRHHISPSPNAHNEQRLMGACALAAAALAERESWGWTLTLKGQPFGFFCGVEPEGMICVRTKPADESMAKAYLQRQKKGAPMMQSHFQPQTDDLAQVVEQYFTQSQQTATRIAVDDQGSGVLIQALPGGQFSEVAEWTDERLTGEIANLAEQKLLKPMTELLVFYECHCTDDMILDLVSGLSAEQTAEMWGDSPEIEMECPRCGRNYTLQRATKPVAGPGASPLDKPLSNPLSNPLDNPSSTKKTIH